LRAHFRLNACFLLQVIHTRSQGRDLRSQRINLVQKHVQGPIRRLTWRAGHVRTLSHLTFGAKFLFGYMGVLDVTSGDQYAVVEATPVRHAPSGHRWRPPNLNFLTTLPFR